MDYDDIQLLECTRQASVQARTGNDTDKALFTTTLGNTIELKEGDEISVQNAFVSEDGAGGDGIEFKGEPIMNDGGNKGVTATYEFTRVETTYDHTFKEIGNKSVELVRTAEGGERNDYVTKTLYDNIVNIQSTFYKTNNGECCFMMPRRYLYVYGQTAAQSFDADDTETLGQSYFLPSSTEGHMIVDADYFLTTDASYGYGGHTRTYFKPRHDNSRFTMFMRIDNYRKKADAPTDYFTDFGRSVMVKDYVEYIELKELTVKKGFNSPNSVAEQITEQLQRVVEYNDVADVKRSQPEVLDMNDLGQADISADGMPIRALSTWHSNLYKPVFCFTPPTSDTQHFTDFYDGTDSQRTCDYIAAFQYIYVKRPDLFKYGRAMNNGNGLVAGIHVGGAPSTPVPNFIHNEIALNSTTDPIITQWEYTTNNLEKLSLLFDAQGKYPELFDNVGLKVGDREGPGDNFDRKITNSRFLHINQWKSYNDAHNFQHQLGDDGIYDWSAEATEDTSHQSIPIFFYYDTAYRNIDTGGTSTDRLSYGFATKTRALDPHLNDGTKGWYITLHPELFEHNPYLPVYFANYGPGPIPAGQVQIGWDYHANSYGNVVMGGTNGLWAYQYWNSYSYGVLNKKPTTTDTPAGKMDDLVDFMNVMYIGANNPALKFDTDSGTFGWEYLHTAEQVGQPFDAGATELRMGAGENTKPLVSDASNECYKINKRLQYWNFTPDMRPYNLVMDLVLGASSADAFTTAITNFNQNLEKWNIYDAHAGVFLNLGDTASESDWSKTLLGILGFTWAQFNSQSVDERNNNQARVNNNNIHNLDKLITTNSQIVSTDTTSFNMNIWGGINYGTMISPPLMINTWDVVS